MKEKVDRKIKKKLVVFFRRLTDKQRERLKEHARRKSPICCGATTVYFATATGAG